jgi:uncharacterized BrkB/YihY/UPF0761 family membrane protein
MLSAKEEIMMKFCKGWRTERVRRNKWKIFLFCIRAGGEIKPSKRASSITFLLIFSLF